MYNKLKTIAIDEGARLFGVAKLAEPIRTLTHAISIGWPLSPTILSQLEGHPTKLYYHHYRQVNFALDRLALKLANIIEEEGYQAIAVPASQVIDQQSQKGELCHKTIGEQAGLGWLGRNNLLINELYGAKFRLVTILTSYPLPVDKPVDKACGTCFACLEACPSKAIRENRQDFDHQGCFEALKAFKQAGHTGQHICGLCVKICDGKK